ncbi:hypothetical protein DCS_00683 [Drechmeria coniospora]|uniref:F-box domain-containing protein n=1 Tax=Drechmeria coniospora TaxID=98403 RepID=A0A151GR36_DRECN|nr:hypothetical protein DCS_00683 [Drechmeria coniospora]KYK59553.1 hypothetical protein DCS_00683 [Drechmeria coniospora]
MHSINSVTAVLGSFFLAAFGGRWWCQWWRRWHRGLKSLPSVSSTTGTLQPAQSMTTTMTAAPARIPREKGTAEKVVAAADGPREYQGSQEPPGCSGMGSHLLQLPTDVLILLCDQLEPPETLALLVSCRSLYALRDSMRRQTDMASPTDRRRFLLLLERDDRLGRGVFYCHACNYLHPFQPSWGPRSDDEARAASGPYHCGSRDLFAPVGNRFGLSYTHARLVMNRHLFGDDRGIPLSNLCVEHAEQRGPARILCRTDACIDVDELFLCRTYSFAVAADDAAALAAWTGPRDFRLCEHTSFFSNTSVFRQSIAVLQPASASASASAPVPFAACSSIPGSCALCLTDYDVTISPPARDGLPRHVTVRAYHQLGACRSPSDWKWARFTEACRPHLFFPNKPNRRGSSFGPGAVRERWVKMRSAPPFPSQSPSSSPSPPPTLPQLKTPEERSRGVANPWSTWSWPDTKPLSVAVN